MTKKETKLNLSTNSCRKLINLGFFLKYSLFIKYSMTELAQNRIFVTSDLSLITNLV